MKGKALYKGKWYKIANINFDTGYLALIDDTDSSLGTLGGKLSIDIKSVDDIKIIK